MTILLLLMGFQVSWTNVASLDPVVTLAPLPEDGDWFLQSPQQISVDEDTGRYFVLDVESYSVFVWDKAGEFQDQFGKKGSGPGEFVFTGRRGRGQGFMTIHNETVFVFDPAKREILTFSAKDYSFKGAVPFQLARSRPEYCEVLPNDTFLVSYRRFSEEGLFRNVGLFDKSGKEISELQSSEDESFKMSQGSGGRRNRTFTITAFAPLPVVSYDPIRDHILIGHSESPKFEVFDQKGQKLKALKFDIPHRQVRDEDIAEFNEQPFIKNSRRRISTNFPDNKAFYDKILTLKEGYLVFNRSPYYRIMEGVVLDLEGAVKARFKIRCGENGDLVGSEGRLFGIITDDEGEFTLHELQANVKSSKS